MEFLIYGFCVAWLWLIWENIIFFVFFFVSFVSLFTTVIARYSSVFISEKTQYAYSDNRVSKHQQYHPTIAARPNSVYLTRTVHNLTFHKTRVRSNLGNMIEPNGNIHCKCDIRRKTNLSSVKGLQEKRDDAKWPKLKRCNNLTQLKNNTKKI
jgi:hypothetical protein